MFSLKSFGRMYTVKVVKIIWSALTEHQGSIYQCALLKMVTCQVQQLNLCFGGGSSQRTYGCMDYLLFSQPECHIANFSFMWLDRSRFVPLPSDQSAACSSQKYLLLIIHILHCLLRPISFCGFATRVCLYVVFVSGFEDCVHIWIDEYYWVKFYSNIKI